MRPANTGHVLNVVSLAGLAAPPGETVYSATKHAALAFTVGTLYDLRQEGCKNVQISAICPDGIWTPMLFDKVDDQRIIMALELDHCGFADSVRAIGRAELERAHAIDDRQHAAA